MSPNNILVNSGQMITYIWSDFIDGYWEVNSELSNSTKMKILPPTLPHASLTTSHIARF
jgi:hypothetical protein